MTTYWAYEHDLDENISRSFGDNYPNLPYAIDAALSLVSARGDRVIRIVDNDTHSTVWIGGDVEYLERYFRGDRKEPNPENLPF